MPYLIIGALGEFATSCGIRSAAAAEEFIEGYSDSVVTGDTLVVPSRKIIKITFVNQERYCNNLIHFIR